MQLGIFGILTIIFVIAKLAGGIAWPWWIVLAPLWGGFLIGAMIVLVPIVIAFIIVWITGK